jgi:hypothetical protein
MKWSLVAVLALACLPARAAEIYGCYNGSAQQGGHRLTTNGIQSSQYAQQSYPATTVTVFQHGTGTPASIFSDASGANPLPNPFTSSSTGVAFWCAADGKYDVQYSGTTITAPFSVSDISLSFSGGGGGGGGGTGTVGPGTLNHLSRFTSGSTIGDSLCSDDGITPMACPLGMNLVGNALFIQKPNNASTGTTANLLISRDVNGFAINATPTDTNNLIGIAGFGAGSTGNVSIAYIGQFPCQFDNQTAIGDWVILGSNSQCHDAGSTQPTAIQAEGRVASINGGTGTLATVDMGLPDVTSASSGSGGGNGTVANCNTPGSNSYHNTAGNTVECDPNFLDDGAGNFQAVSGVFTGPDAGFVAMVQGTAPDLTLPTSASNAAYWHAPTVVTVSFDTAVPNAPGLTGQILTIDSFPDATHNTTNWTWQGGTPRLYAALPTCDANHEGMLGAITNGNSNTWGAAVIGGGANHVLAYCNGSAWTVAAK